MEAKNLTEDNVGILQEKLEEMQKENPDLQYKFFSQMEKENMEGKDCEQCINGLKEQIEILNGKIDRIFGKAVLINGVFHNL